MHGTQFTSNAVLILRHSTYYTLRMKVHIVFDAYYTIPATLYFTTLYNVMLHYAADVL